MTGAHGERAPHNIDLHVHVADGDPRSDAPFNTHKNVLPAAQLLLASGTVTALLFLGHDRFPETTARAARRRLPPDIDVLMGNEVAARVPDRKGRMVHLLAYFPEQPLGWSLPSTEWPKSWKAKLKTLSNLPPVDEVAGEILDKGGVLAIAHPTPDRLVPWGSFGFGELRRLIAEGKLPPRTPVELNGHWIHRGVNSLVGRFAERNGLPLVGGSDAHVPDFQGRRTTTFPNVSGDTFLDLQAALAEGTTQVVHGRMRNLFYSRRDLPRHTHNH